MDEPNRSMSEPDGPPPSPPSPPDPSRGVLAWPPSLPTLRDLTSIGLAVMIFVHETLLVEAADPALIAAGFALLGFPAVVRAESRR